jgi:hypothetical protein
MMRSYLNRSEELPVNSSSRLLSAILAGHSKCHALCEPKKKRAERSKLWRNSTVNGKGT